MLPSHPDSTRFRQLFDDWRSYMVAGFSLVAVANLYMSLFGRLRGVIKEEKVETALAEEASQAQRMKCTPSHPSAALGPQSALSLSALIETRKYD